MIKTVELECMGIEYDAEYRINGDCASLIDIHYTNDPFRDAGIYGNERDHQIDGMYDLAEWHEQNPTDLILKQ